MKTFDACQGNKYIYYDYEKHMKGLKEKGKYNQFLRDNSHTVRILKKHQHTESNAQEIKNSSLNISQYE